MAKDKSTPDTKAETKAETKGEPAAPISAETSAGKKAVAKLLNAKVRVPALDDDGQPIVEKGVYRMVSRKVTAADILAVKRRGDKIVVVTCDGQKLEVAA